MLGMMKMLENMTALKRKVKSMKMMDLMSRTENKRMVYFALMPNLAKRMEITRMTRTLRTAKKTKGTEVTKKVLRTRRARVTRMTIIMSVKQVTGLLRDDVFWMTFVKDRKAGVGWGWGK